MADITKVYSYVGDLIAGTHDGIYGADTDALKFALSNTTPVLSWTVLGDIGQIAYTNVTETWPFDTENAFADSNGTITVTGIDATVTASGAVASFRYVWLYNSGVADAGDELIGYWDNGAEVTLTSGQVFTANLDTNELLILT